MNLFSSLTQRSQLAYYISQGSAYQARMVLRRARGWMQENRQQIGRPSIKDNDIPQLRQLWHDKDESDNSFTMDANTIAERNYQLSLNTYRRISTDHENWIPLNELCDIHI